LPVPTQLLRVEDNLVHDTNRQAFHQHYGRENVVRNNVFAFGDEGQIQLSRTDDGHGYPDTLTVERTADPRSFVPQPSTTEIWELARSTSKASR